MKRNDIIIEQEMEIQQLRNRVAELEAWANRPITDNTQLIANMEAQITDLEAEVARLTAIIEDMKVVDNVSSK